MIPRPIDNVLARLTLLPHTGPGWKGIRPLTDGDHEHVVKIDVLQDGRLQVCCHYLCPTPKVKDRDRRLKLLDEPRRE